MLDRAEHCQCCPLGSSTMREDEQQLALVLPAACSNIDNMEDSEGRSIVSYVLYLMMGLWNAFPVVWLLAELHLISPAAEHLCWGICDYAAKVCACACVCRVCPRTHVLICAPAFTCVPVDPSTRPLCVAWARKCWCAQTDSEKAAPAHCCVSADHLMWWRAMSCLMPRRLHAPT